MNVTLTKMRAWIEAEQEKAKKDYADKFDLTSLTFCGVKAAGGDAFEAVKKKLWAAAEAERLGRYDVVTPDEAIRVIDRALIS